MLVSYRGLRFYVSSLVYKPSDDTFLLADCIPSKVDGRVLDLGTGCGILAVLAALRGASHVVGVDINPHAMICLLGNARAHGVLDRVEFRLGSLFQPLKRGERFNLILFNPPYLPVEWSGRLEDAAWAGGRRGRRLIDPFISEVGRWLTPGGRALMVQLEKNGIDESLRRAEEAGLSARVVSERKLFFERLVVLELSRR
ncbi:MAG: hypothetical protein DRN99_02595 [Thermoproteota archaeon]|nr:MAG: hypothetical protein DRN99_02595 [Candidatus Korarchaeota archaeon]